MNYYEHHLGDYLRDTAHLSMLEDGAYRRLIDAYYIREAPLPANLRDVFRLVRAQSKQDREAVETVLREFFSEGPDGWWHGRCEREIERFREKSEKARASIRTRWDKARATAQAPEQPNNERNTGVSTAGYERNTDDIHRAPVPRHQTPDTSNQTPEFNTAPTPDGVGGRPSADPPRLALVPGYTPPDCPHLLVLALWAEVLPAQPQHEPQQWRGARADHLRARWRETAAAKRWPDQQAGLQYLRKLFGYVGQSRFLSGRVTPRDPSRPPFNVTLAWLVRPTNWAEVIEGKYHQEAA